VLADELASLRHAQPRTRNRTLNRAAFKVYRYVGGGVLDDHDVTAAFAETALAIGLDTAEVRRTLASARAAGLANPRGVPAPDQPKVGA
jgi:predicted trehalose synthase